MTKPILTEDKYQFKVFPKDRIAVLGAQGAGKSDFLKALESDQTLTIDNALIGKDPVTGAEYLSEISNDERAVIAVLPSIAWAKRFANRVVGVASGKVVFDSEVSSLDQDAFRKIYLVSNPNPATPQVLKVGVSTTSSVAVGKELPRAASLRKSVKKSKTTALDNRALILMMGVSLGALVTFIAQRLLGIV